MLRTCATGGAIPRGIVHYPSNPNITLVYCWGLNQVRAYIVNPAAATVSPRATYQLNYDPTPPEIAAGRTVFFDGDHSQERNDSCASCHIEGGSDFLVWNLSNGTMEEKGPMFTQTLVGLSRLPPFHWRGERQLIESRRHESKSPNSKVHALTATHPDRRDILRLCRSSAAAGRYPAHA